MSTAGRTGAVTSQVRFVWEHFKFNLAAAMEYKAGFVSQVVFMLLNDMFLLFFWWIVFRRVSSIGGLDVPARHRDACHAGHVVRHQRRRVRELARPAADHRRGTAGLLPASAQRPALACVGEQERHLRPGGCSLRDRCHGSSGDVSACRRCRCCCITALAGAAIFTQLPT